VPGTTFRLTPRGPYSLAASTAFLEGFAPAAYEGAERGHLHLAFPADESGDPAGTCVRQPGKIVSVESFGSADAQTVREQVRRILSLDADGSAWRAVGRRDPVIGDLQRRFHGLRPVLFNSPYEAAAWAVIGLRVRIAQAARTKEAMARDLGGAVDIHGDARHAFPPPARLARLEEFPGLFGRKPEWLCSLGEAAAAGALDVGRLRSLPPADALAELERLPGIGRFAAELTLIRGVGTTDVLPTAEPRLARAISLAYRLRRPPTQARITEMADAWRPYRTWAAVLLRSFLENETGEIAGRTGIDFV
jgi:DNA-3-methyladenine glycosylase II